MNRIEELRESWALMVGEDPDEWGLKLFDKYSEEVEALLRVTDTTSDEDKPTPIEAIDISKYADLLQDEPIPLDRLTAFRLELNVLIAESLQSLSESELREIYTKSQDDETQTIDQKDQQLHDRFEQYLGEFESMEGLTEDQFIDWVQSGIMLNQSRDERDQFFQRMRDHGSVSEDELIYPDPGKSYIMPAREFLILLQKDSEYGKNEPLSAIENSPLVTVHSDADDELHIDDSFAVFTVRSLNVPDEGPLNLLNRFLVEGHFEVYTRLDTGVRLDLEKEPFTAGEGVLDKSSILGSIYNPVTEKAVETILRND